MPLFFFFFSFFLSHLSKGRPLDGGSAGCPTKEHLLDRLYVTAERASPAGGGSVPAAALAGDTLTLDLRQLPDDERVTVWVPFSMDVHIDHTGTRADTELSVTGLEGSLDVRQARGILGLKSIKTAALRAQLAGPGTLTADSLHVPVAPEQSKKKKKIARETKSKHANK